MARFQPLLSTYEWEVWSEWLTTSEKRQLQGLDTNLMKQYIVHRSERPALPPSVHNQKPHQFPTHLPRIQPSFHGSAERVLEMVLESRSNQSANSSTNQTGRSGLVVPPTYSGGRHSTAPLGTVDLSDMSSGQMALWLRENTPADEECPFWMGKVTAINRQTSKLHVSWYGTRQKAPWREATWMPWYNVLTPEMFQEMSAQDKKKYRSQIGRACLPSEDIMDLDPTTILFYNFSLRNNGRLSKSTISSIEKQLKAEQLL